MQSYSVSTAMSKEWQKNFAKMLYGNDKKVYLCG